MCPNRRPGRGACWQKVFMARVPSQDDLRYLAHLTAAGLKPLSRWEGSFDPGIPAALERAGLHWRTVRRAARSGRSVTELVFSTQTRWLDLYARRFDNRSLDRTPGDRRVEGWLFGYPSCCVESYLAHGYRPNRLRWRDQGLLFHWACPRCAVTPVLVSQYRRVYRTCRAGDRAGLSLESSLSRLSPQMERGLRQALALAASLVALGALHPLAVAGPPPDPHQVPLEVWQDADRDGLMDAQELLLRLDPNLADQDGNGIADGVDWALSLSAAIDALPEEVSPATPYRLTHMTFGLETCNICGEAVNMGFYEVVNPLETLSATVPCIAKHYLEHGSLAYAGSEHQGFLNVPLVRTALESSGQAHLLLDDHQTPVVPDQDEDLLTDREELDLQTDPAQADENANRTPDGVDLALECAARIAKLPVKPDGAQPYRLDFEVKGLEQCAVCGTNVNMGHLTVCHPRAQLYASVPYIALHHLEHGSFSHAGDVHGAGRLDPLLVRSVLDETSPSHFVPAREDADADGLSDAEEKRFGTDPAQADTDIDGVPDGFALARGLWESIGQLTRDTGPPVHAVDHLMRGLVDCPVCGIQVNMGYVELVNTREQIRVEVSYLALHFLRHGSLGNGDHGRLNPRLIDLALRGDGMSHLVIVPGDTDRDGLLDTEEEALGTDPRRPDSDGDGMPDGLAAARSAFRRIWELPREVRPDQAYALHAEADCYVPCEICGVDVNCGFVELVQPWTEVRTTLSYRLLHSLEHGSFAASPEERADPLQIEAFLRPSLLILGDGEHPTLRWYGTLGRSYEVQSADALAGPWRSVQVLAGANAPLTFSENPEHPPSGRFLRLLVW